LKTSAQRGSQACGRARVIGSFCGQARGVQQTAEMRGFVVRASLAETRSIFTRGVAP